MIKELLKPRGNCTRKIYVRDNLIVRKVRGQVYVLGVMYMWVMYMWVKDIDFVSVLSICRLYFGTD
jgi:hypothetical protein